MSSQPAKVLSCTYCREKKVKCDKLQPICTPCLRSGLDCQYPSRKPMRRAPRPRQRELMDRISRLESIVGRADPSKLEQLDKEDAQLGQSLAHRGSEGSSSLLEVQPTSSKAESQSPAKSTPEAYISHEFWGNICDEVEGIRNVLNQPSDDEDEVEAEVEAEVQPGSGYDSSSLSPQAVIMSGFALGNPAYHERDMMAHPSEEQRNRLWEMYVRNVDPLVKILHRPSVRKDLDELASMPPMQNPSPANNALFFAIYFSATATMTSGDCLLQTGEDRAEAVRKYQVLTERALAAADYLNTTDLKVLQAFTIYVDMTRFTSHGRASWSMTALLVRLAQAMNLHRDGDGQRFSIFEAEMRRRLWSFIVLLDARGCEDRGTEAIITRSSYNTFKPTPIDDVDFSPASTQPLVPKTSGPADNVAPLCFSMNADIFSYLFHKPLDVSAGAADSDPTTDEELMRYIREIETTFIHAEDRTHLPSRYAAIVARLCILKLWLVIQYPFSAVPAGTRPRVSRELILRAAISALELNENKIDPPWSDRYAWQAVTWPQWHPLAVALTELCMQTRGPTVDKAWVVVDRVLPINRDRVADSASGNLWKPIRKLLKKARAARSEEQMKNLSIGESMPAATMPGPEEPGPEDGLTQAIASHVDQVSAVGLGNTTMQSFDTTTMDPSWLFEYHPAQDFAAFDDFGVDTSMDWTPWNDFLVDSRMEFSPEGSGGDSGTT